MKLSISEQPYAIPIEMRPMWRISLIVIAIAVVGGEKTYLEAKKLNILVWMLIRKSKWSEYEDFLQNRSFDLPLISVDTSTFKAIEISIAKDFISLGEGRVYIREEGLKLYEFLLENEILQDEMRYLESVGKKLTDGKVKELTGKLI